MIRFLEKDQKIPYDLLLPADTIEIKNIAVDETFQGQGIGQRLLRDAIDRSKKMGSKKIIIGTGDAAIKQLYLYQKVGFEIYALNPDSFLTIIQTDL